MRDALNDACASGALKLQVETMSSGKDAPDLGAYSRGQEATESDDEVFAELEREVEELNEADADDAARLGNTSLGRGRDDELAQAFREYREKRLAEIQAECVEMAWSALADEL